MRSVRRGLSVIGVVLLATVGCERATMPTAPNVTPSSAVVLGDWTLVRTVSTQSSTSVSVTIGSAGGTMSVNGHSLMVPAGALTEPLTFTMSTVAGSSVEVSLSAQNQKGAPVTVFASPVQLSLSYSGAKVKNVSALKVAYLVNGVIVAVQPSEVDKSQKVVRSWLSHFSDYGIAN